MNIAIIGYGIVGKNMHKIFPEAEIIDPPKGLLKTSELKTDIAFICVPTPSNPDGSCNIDLVENAIKENESEIYCIKSTVTPGTTRKLTLKYKKRLVFSPEFFGETIDANNQDYDFVILGGDTVHCIRVAEIYKRKYTGRFHIRCTDSITSELAKYFENSYLAMKVTFCQEFFRIAEAVGVNYDELRELFILDPRVNPSHTVVYRDQPYYDSKCLNKDLPAIAAFARSINTPAVLLENVIARNATFKGADKFLKSNEVENEKREEIQGSVKHPD
jgi:UDPglucose 6-dehydrogenase